MPLPINDLDLEFLNIETYVLKVHLNCQGCRNRVKKLLRKIKGVYEVKIDAEGERVMVSGTVGADTLINKLFRSGKHAELIWSPTSINIQEQALPLMPIKDHTNRNRNQLLQQYLMNPQDYPNHHFSVPLNHSPSLPFGSEGEIDQNLMMPFPLPMNGNGNGNGNGYDYGNGGFSDYNSLYGYGYDIHDHQSPMTMSMSNRYYNSPVLQSPVNMYDGDVHMMHHPYGAATDYRSSLVSPYSHYSFTIPPAPYTNYY